MVKRNWSEKVEEKETVRHSRFDGITNADGIKKKQLCKKSVIGKA